MALQHTAASSRTGSHQFCFGHPSNRFAIASQTHAVGRKNNDCYLTGSLSKHSLLLFFFKSFLLVPIRFIYNKNELFPLTQKNILNLVWRLIRFYLINSKWTLSYHPPPIELGWLTAYGTLSNLTCTPYQELQEITIPRFTFTTVAVLQPQPNQ